MLLSDQQTKQEIIDQILGQKKSVTVSPSQDTKSDIINQILGISKPTPVPEPATKPSLPMIETGPLISNYLSKVPKELTEAKYPGSDVDAAITNTLKKVGTGFVEAVNPIPMIQEGYKLWKEGNVHGMADLLTGGALSSTPESGAAAVTALQNLRPTTAISELAKAIPIFGPMAAAVESKLRDGKYAEAFGAFIGVIAIAKGPQVTHDALTIKATNRAVSRVESVMDEARVKVQEVSKISNEELKQIQLKVIEDEAKQKAKEVIDDVATEVIVEGDIKAKAQQIKDIKSEPVWPPRTEAQQIAAAKAFKKAMPGKEELIARAEGTLVPRVEPEQPSTLAKGPFPGPETKPIPKPKAKSKTAKEQKVLDLAKQGRDNAQISFKLDISESEIRRIKGEVEVVVERFYTGSDRVFNSTADMPEGHRGYFATPSIDVAKKFGKNIHEVSIKTNKIFDGTNEVQRNILIDKLGSLRNLENQFTKKSINDQISSGSHSVYEDNLTTIALKDLGFKGNWQIEDKTKVIRLFDKSSFSIKPTEQNIIPKQNVVDFDTIVKDLMIGPEEIAAIEKHFGKEIYDVPDASIEAFLRSDKAGKKPEPAPTKAKPTESKMFVDETDIEKFYGRPLDKLTPEEIDSFFDLEPVDKPRPEPGPITDIDLRTGTPEPPALVGDQSIFRTDKATTDARTEMFAKKKGVASSVDEALNQLPDRPIRDIFVTGQKLLNDVNRWLSGEKIDIEGTRDFLSDIAVRSDEFRNLIISYGGGEQDFFEWKEMVSEAANWARKVDRPKIGPTGGTQLYGGLPIDEIVRRLKKVHPATFPKTIQSAMADVANKLGVTDILDIFGGIGKIGKIKDYGYTGKVSTNEIEPRWGGQSTEQLSKNNKVDNVNIGDARKLPNKDNSVQAIFTSPTYGNLMALKSPSKIDSYQSLAGGKLMEGNTGGEVWGPEYERLHKEAYREAYRVVEPGGFFVLNMKDKPVSATDIKNNWIPKKGSTVEVRDQVMKATDWHTRALEDAGFEFITSTEVGEAIPASAKQRFLRQYTTGKENLVVMGKPILKNIKSSLIEQTENISLFSGIDPFEVSKGIKKWYSTLRRVAEDKLPNVASAEQVTNTLRKNVTHDEWKASKLEEILKPGTRVRKEDVIAQIDRNVPEFKDVVLERGGPRELDTKFSTYQEPGGANYKELFVTAPSIGREYPRVFEDPNLPGYWRVEGHPLPYPTKESAGLASGASRRPSTWLDGHPGYAEIENTIVRLRFNDRVDTQGKKILFIEEMQPPSPSEQAKMPPEFVKRWREIGMKRAIKYGVDGGYDKVAWTTGEMQANRYLKGVQDRVTGLEYDPGNEVLGYRRRGKDKWEAIDVPKNRLSSYIGQELAEVLLESGKYSKLDNIDATLIGGAGLRRLYDLDLPNVAKKLGGKVESTTIKMIDRSDQYTPSERSPRIGGEIVPSISLSPFKESWQPTLYSGIPVDKIKQLLRNIKGSFTKTEEAKASPDSLSDIVKLGSDFGQYMLDADKAKTIDFKNLPKHIREEFTRAFIERSGNAARKLVKELGDRGYEIKEAMYLQKGGHPKATRMAEQLIKEYSSGLTANEKKIRDGLILSRRILDVTEYKTEKQFTPPERASRNNALVFNELFDHKSQNHLEELTPERANVVETAAHTYEQWMKKAVYDAHDEGLINKVMRDELVAHNYRRIRLVEQLFDKKNEVTLGGKKITVYDSGIERLAKGKKTDIYESNSELMALETFNRIYGRIYKNRANKELLDLARTDKENPFARVKESKEDKIPAEFRSNRTFVYEDGKRKTVFLSPKIAEEWLASSAEMTYKLSQFVKWASGAPLLRTFATGINWAFALRNLPRDSTHLWLTSRTFEGGKYKTVYNPTAPIAVADLAKDMASVSNDVLLRKNKFDDYIDDGGGMNLLAIQGRLFEKGKHIGGPLDKIQDFLGYPGTTSELMTRLAIRERVLKNEAVRLGKTYEEVSRDPKIRRKATFAARDSMDFNQGGSIIKALDNGLPYLSAGIVAVRGFVRSLSLAANNRANAAVTMYKLAQFAGAVTALYIGNQLRSPKTMREMEGDERATGNFVFPLGDSFDITDKIGQTRYPFIVIPVDQSVRFFKVLFEAGTDKWMGKEIDVDKITQSLYDLSPVDIATLPPTVSGALGYTYNKDFWLGKDIWTQTKEPFSYPSSKEEYIPGKTPQAMVDIGEATKLSPERLKYVVGQLITNDNMYAQLLGAGYEKMYGKLPKSKREQHLAEWLSQVPVVRSFLKLTNPSSKYIGDMVKAEEKAVIDNFIETRGLDVRVNGYLSDKNITREEVVKYITSFKDPNTIDRLKDDFVFQEKTKDIPNRVFWLGLKRLSVDARASYYVKEMAKASPAERNEITRELGRFGDEKGQIPGIITDRFKQEVMRLQEVSK